MEVHPFDLPDEAGYTCWSCGEVIVVPIDACEGGRQDYVEDCPVCCRPNRLRIEIEDDGEVRARSDPP